MDCLELSMMKPLHVSGFPIRNCHYWNGHYWKIWKVRLVGPTMYGQTHTDTVTGYAWAMLSG